MSKIDVNAGNWIVQGLCMCMPGARWIECDRLPVLLFSYDIENENAPRRATLSIHTIFRPAINYIFEVEWRNTNQCVVNVILSDGHFRT